MMTSYWVIFLIFVRLLFNEIGASDIITSAPLSMPAQLYTFVDFPCQGIGDVLKWTVQGNLLTDPSNQDREISVTTNNISVDVWSSVLTIRALPINNRISVSCTVISFSSQNFEKKGATLTIKGVSLIENLEFSFFNKPSSLTWSSPFFYSEDIPQGSITTYHVIVKNKDGSIIVDDNTTDTFYEVPNKLTVCDIYTASVRAIIEQYSSPTTTTTEQNIGNCTNYVMKFNHFNDSVDISIKQIQLITNVKISTENKAANITEAPSSVIILLYTLANFICKGIGYILEWAVQGNSLTDVIKEYREISVTTNNISVGVWSSVLTIRALPINDGISIACTVISFNPPGFMEKGATLTIRGISPIEQLDFQLNNNPYLIWSPPSFYSNDIPQGSITTYHVSVKRQDGSVIVDDNTTDTFYELPSKFTVCDIYIASVAAFIEQYTSNDVSSRKEYSGNYTVEIKNYTVIFDDTETKFIILFKLKVNGIPRLCNSLLFGTTEDNDIVTTYHLQYIGNTTTNGDVIISYNITDLGPFNNYTFTVYITDTFNDTKDRDHIIFTTYNVQGLTLQYYSDIGSVLVECRFAERSTADGCSVIFKADSAKKSINISKSSIEESTVYQYITLPVSGNYTVTAHDIVDDTIITKQSLKPLVLEYFLPLPSPSPTIIPTSTTLNVITVDITSTTHVTITSIPSPSSVSESFIYICIGGSLLVLVVLVLVVILVRIIVIVRHRRHRAVRFK